MSLELKSVELKLDMPVGAFSALKESPEGFGKRMRLTAAAKWYDMGLISQGKAAEIAGVSRSEFIFSLAQFGISAIQLTPEELDRELSQ